MMNYIFKGRLQGRICEQCLEPLAGLKVRLYRAGKGQNVTALASVAPKETFSILTDQDVRGKQNNLLAETVMDGQGNFVFDLGEEEKYAGEAFEVDVYCETVPGRQPGKIKYPPVQFSITILQPQWRDWENGLIAAWDYTVPSRFWCGIRARFGAWVICGIVTVCETQIPVQGVRVRAFDVDWLQDDELGTALTDGAGKFRIDYGTEDFKETPLSPWINWEMIGGPDLYFKIETPSGTLLQGESPARGRNVDRENAGPCFCVQLCLKDVPEQVPTDHTYPLFTKVGSYRITTDFTASGLTQSGNYAFTDTLSLRGILPDGGDSLAMEYRFRFGRYSGGTLGSLEDVDSGMIVPTVIGQIEFWRFNGLLGVWEIDSEDYWINNPGATHNIPVKPGGWIEVPRENDIGLPPAPGAGKFVPNSWLIKLNSRKLVDEFFDLTSSPSQHAGDAVPPGKKPETHTFALTFEARTVGSTIVSDTNTLDKIIISNLHYKYNLHPGWAPATPTRRAVCMLDIKEMVDHGSGCGTLSNDLGALFTVYHPFAEQVSVYFEGNPPLPPSFAPVLAGGEAVSGSIGHHFDISALLPCAYIIWLRVDLNLTRGWGRISDYRIWDHIAFCTA
ncbi:hypothetical protein [Desulfomarina profundi]|nr:hypothetical protein [Desulfomarina profundi]